MKCGMGNHLGLQLSRLVRSRAYRAGDLERLKQEERDAREALKAATRSLRFAQRKQRAVESEIQALDVEIERRALLDISLIRSIKMTPRQGPFRHGELTASIVQLLKEAAGPATSRQVILALVEALNLPYASPAEREATRRRIVEKLRVLARRGAVTRLHDPTRSIEGIWLWVGL